MKTYIMFGLAVFLPTITSSSGTSFRYLNLQFLIPIYLRENIIMSNNTKDQEMEKPVVYYKVGIVTAAFGDSVEMKIGKLSQ